MNEWLGAAKPITNSDDYIDSRDIERRIRFLEVDEEALDAMEAMELSALKDLRDEAEGYSADWMYEASLIRDSEIENYMDEFVQDVYGVDTSQWPFCCIDWDKARWEFLMDYTEVDFDGVSYWIR